MKWGITVFIILALLMLIIERSSKSEISSVIPVKAPQKTTINMSVEIDGDLPTPSDKSTDEGSWQTESLRALLDFYVAYFEEGEQKMWQEFNQYCHPLSYCLDLTDLFERYLAYKRQLQHFDNERLELAAEYEERLDKLGILRSELFSAFEISLLFNNEEQWDRHAIERMRIKQDPSLTPQQKAQLITQQLDQLPEQMKQAVQPTQALRKIAQISNNSAIDSSYEYNQLAAEFGEEAAQRLVAVNKSKHSWLSKIQRFQERRDELKQVFNQDPQAYSEALTQLKQNMFEANEQKRLQVYLANPTLLKAVTNS